VSDAAGGTQGGSGFRVGTGYDIHRLAEGRRLVLGGVEIPFERGLLGHSDGDALTHAVIDALFGACGLPDIGRHFPPGDPRYKDAVSVELLTQAVELARGAGWQAVNVDATVICERPKLAPHIDAIRTSLAQRLALALKAVNVKAKTNEGLDAVGRGEAIATHAIILMTSAPPEAGGTARRAASERHTSD
jgi:2-C-methyl-D-erythritol 2,4-cyclodiphosphate synthase